MSDISLEDKFNLRNKYLDKIIKNINQATSSLELLNNFNHKMIRQYGGTQEQFSAIHKSLQDEIGSVETMTTNITEQLGVLRDETVTMSQNLELIHDKLTQLKSGITNIDESKLDNINTIAARVKTN
jgi:chromosome segregation ATPase